MKVNCHHGGQFKKEEGVLTFVDGELVLFKMDLAFVFTALMLKLFERRIVTGKMWFKLPFESLDV